MNLKGNEPDNPQTLTIRGLENNARRFLIGNQNITRGVERRLRRNPDLSRQLDSLGGLQTALTAREDIEERRQGALNFTDYTNTLYLDQFFGGNPDTVPLAQTMAEDIGSIRRVTTAIAEELNDCCAEVKALLNELLRLIPSSFTRQRLYLTTKLKSVTRVIQNSLSQAVTRLTHELTESEERTKRLVEVQSSQVKADVKINLDSAERRIIAAIIAAIEPLPAAFFASVEGLIETQTTFILSGIAGVEGTLDILLALVRNIASRVNSIREAIEELPEDILKRLEELYKKHKQEVIAEISEEVSLKIVGESYYKWNNTSSFYPTLVLKFKETEVFNKARVTQLKLKLRYTSSELTDAQIKQLANKLIKLKGLSYLHGPIRGNFVSKDKRFKTTVFASSEGEIENLLKSVLELVEEPFIRQNLSITFGRKRDSITRRTEPLGNTPVFVQDYTS